MFRKISRRFLLYPVMLAVILLLLASGMRWMPNASAQSLIIIALTVSFVPEADCSVSSYEVEASDSLRVVRLNVSGALSRDKSQCEFIVQGRLSQVGPVISYSGISVLGDSLQFGRAEVESWGSKIDFIFWENAQVTEGIQNPYQMKFVLHPTP